jgi:HTH-type transcriptional regulator/antitoxin HigA
MNDIVATIDHPGTFILEELEAREWTQVDLAYILGMSPSQLNPILKGKGNISPEMAIALGDAFDVSPEFFANLQKQYELQQAKRPDPGVRTRAFWFSKFPVREMETRGWIESSDADLLDLQIMRFFDANRVEDVPLVGCDPMAHAAKKTEYEEITGSQLVWLHRVRKIAAATEAPSYDRSKLESALPDIRAHMFDAEDFSEIPALLLACGVRLVFVEHLPGAKIDGVCTWLGDQPVIGLSLRLNRPDNTCFVLRHEVEHVLQEDGKEASYTHVDVFDSYRNVSELPDEEQRADAAAAEFLVPQDKLASFMRRKGKWVSEDDVLAFAARHHIHPAIVVGQIQNYRHERGDKRAFTFLRRYLKAEMEKYFDTWPMRDGWGHVAEVGL